MSEERIFSTRDVMESPENKRRRGLFVVVDGPDGIGKGEMETAIRRYEERKGKSVFDTISWSKAWEKLPELKDFWGIPKPHFNVLMTAEPTYVGTGRDIREEITARNGRNYPLSTNIEMYSNDRLIQMQRVVVPAIEHGIDVIQSRCVASTLAYQLVDGNEEGNNGEEIKRQILKHRGNVYQLINRPDLLIIATIDDAKKVFDRLGARGRNEKEDNSIFENLQFQERIKLIYESDWLRKIFEDHGSKIAYLNGGLSIESSRRQAVEIYRSFVEGKEIPEIYRTPESVLTKIV